MLQLQTVTGAGTVCLGTGQDTGQHVELGDCNKLRQSTGKPVQVTMNKGASLRSLPAPHPKKSMFQGAQPSCHSPDVDGGPIG